MLNKNYIVKQYIKNNSSKIKSYKNILENDKIKFAYIGLKIAEHFLCKKKIIIFYLDTNKKNNLVSLKNFNEYELSLYSSLNISIILFSNKNTSKYAHYLANLSSFNIYYMENPLMEINSFEIRSYNKSKYKIYQANKDNKSTLYKVKKINNNLQVKKHEQQINWFNCNTNFALFNTLKTKLLFTNYYKQRIGGIFSSNFQNINNEMIFSLFELLQTNIQSSSYIGKSFIRVNENNKIRYDYENMFYKGEEKFIFIDENNYEHIIEYNGKLKSKKSELPIFGGEIIYKTGPYVASKSLKTSTKIMKIKLDKNIITKQILSLLCDKLNYKVSYPTKKQIDLVERINKNKNNYSKNIFLNTHINNKDLLKEENNLKEDLAILNVVLENLINERHLSDNPGDKIFKCSLIRKSYINKKAGTYKIDRTTNLAHEAILIELVNGTKLVIDFSSHGEKIKAIFQNTPGRISVHYGCGQTIDDLLSECKEVKLNFNIDGKKVIRNFLNFINAENIIVPNYNLFGKGLSFNCQSFIHSILH